MTLRTSLLAVAGMLAEARRRSRPLDRVLLLRSSRLDLGALRDAAARSGMPGGEWYLEQFREG